ncbi:MAG: hypothetical protein IAG13_32040, partial [Deltaproteobacteria bacterium]|nr:hypothetical protein [Nannocystaceae bacterium]
MIVPRRLTTAGFLIMSLPLPVLDTSGSGPLTGPWGDRFAIIRRYDDPRFGARASAREVRSGSDMVVGTMQCPSWAHERVSARLGQLAELEHPKIATLDWQLVGDQLSLARREIIGRTVADHLVEQRALPLGMFVPIASQILMAVGHAHRHGVATGPIDPQDVVLRVESGRQLAVVLTDFGLAEALWPVLRAGQPPRPRAP